MASKNTLNKTRVCVLKCKKNRHMHRFPKDEVGKSVWLKQLGLKHINPSSMVCDHHFSDKMKPNGVGIKLTPWAIPDINLPVRGDSETDEDDYYEDEQFESVMTQKTITRNAHINGHASTDDTAAENNNSDPLDFDDVLAKVHCIADLTNNNNKDDIATSVADDMSMDEEILINDDYSEDNVSVVHSSEKIDNQNIVDENTMSAPSTPVDIGTKFKRKLIASIRKRRVLYDPAHPSFGNIARKTRSWERIGKLQKLDATACRELWLSLRYDYQNHVRNLRQWLAGEGNQRERPRIPFENDLLFLWRYVSDKSYCDESDEEARHTHSVVPQIAEVVAEAPTASSRDAPVAVIDARAADHPYAHSDAEESLQFPCQLIDAVQPYSELYDILHPNYGDVKRKSIIWDAIANELNQIATKCLYTWITLQLRYEFEVMHNKSSYLVNKLNFLKKHILPNEKSLFKRIASPTDEWHGTMNGYKDQHLIIQTLVTSKKYRTFLFNIDLPYAVDKNLHIPCWATVGKAIKRRAEKCELTWIVMQAMYCEVAEFRKHDCLLRHEWEFEAIITNLLANLPSKKLSKIRKDVPLASKKTNDAKRNATVTVEDANADVNPDPDPDPEPIAEPMEYNDIYEPGQVLTLPSEPKEKPNEIKFTIPSQGSGEPLVGGQLVRYTLDKPVADLDEKTIVDIDSVVPNVHILILRRYKKSPAVFPFTLDQRKQLIGEVMARPLLFNEPCKQARLNRVFWGEISIEIGYPADPCMYFWEYILEKSLFLDYDPSWKKTKETKWIPPPNPIFEKFQKYADSRCWGEYISVLPDFIQEISNFPLIYVDLKVNSTWNRRQCHARDIAEVWTILARKFAVLDSHKLIWDKFKQLFLSYMAEIELSIYNAWPKFWFPVLEKMTFLYQLRYDPKQPIYYVIKNKIQDEINQYRLEGNPGPVKLDAVTNGKAIFGLLKENEYLDDFTWVNRARFLAKMKTFPMLYDVNHLQFGNKEAKLEAWQEMALSFHCTVGECHLIFQHLMKSFLLFRARDPNQSCRVNAKYWENMTFIYSCAVPNSIDPKLMEWRSFRTASNGSTIKLAEEFQAEISLVDAKPRLILKNVAAAVNSLPMQIQNSVVHQLKHILTEYTRSQGEDIVVDV